MLSETNDFVYRLRDETSVSVDASLVGDIFEVDVNGEQLYAGYDPEYGYFVASEAHNVEDNLEYTTNNLDEAVNYFK